MPPDPETVCEEYARMIQWLANRYYRGYCGRVPRDDLVQACRIGFWKAAQRYNGLGTFESYARYWCRKYAGIEQRFIQSHGLYSPYTERVTPQQVTRIEEYEALAPEPCEDNNEFWTLLRDILSEKEFTVAVGLVEGLPDKTTARSLGIPRETFRGIKARIARKMTLQGDVS